jgi:hypothetical protein
MRADLVEVVQRVADSGVIGYNDFAALQEAATALRALRDAPVGTAVHLDGGHLTRIIASSHAFPNGTKLRLVRLDTAAGVDRG